MFALFAGLKTGPISWLAEIDLISDDGIAEITVASDGSLTMTGLSGDAFADLAGDAAVLAMDYSISDGRGGSDDAEARLIFSSGGGLQEENTDAALNALV